MEDEKEDTPSQDPPTETDPPEHPHHCDCASRMNSLSEEVSNLRQTVEAIVSIKPDSTPVRGPWTHRKVFR